MESSIWLTRCVVLFLVLAVFGNRALGVDDLDPDCWVDMQFFEMQRHDAVKALEIYKRAGQQVSPVWLTSGA